MSNARSPAGVRSTTVGIVYWPMSQTCLPAGDAGAHVVEALHDVIDDPVVAGFRGAEPAVTQAVLLHPLQRLPGVLRDQPDHRGPGAPQLLGVDLDVGRGATEPGRALMHQHLGVR